jgi:hypothetical protein
MDYKTVLLDALDDDDKTKAEKFDVRFAYCTEPDYNESIYAVLEKDGELFEYSDSHCSCGGFKFNPQPVTKEYIKTMANPYFDGDDFTAAAFNAFNAFKEAL